ncbi:ComEC/Rec2 family competence protein [Demequina soli]|uniref:ComEC/Rec2 family competence protein n=1 Tax=Demequina soli TaxID=1638987 RepID=UPI00078430F0|nr:ComEC/Rec2 family competence protein [Demequina soli]
MGGWGDLRLAPAAVAAWAASLAAWSLGWRAGAVVALAAWAVAAGAWWARRGSSTRGREAGPAALLALAAAAATAAALTTGAAIDARAWMGTHADGVEVRGRVVEVHTVAASGTAPRVAVRIDVAAWRARGGGWSGGRGLVVLVVDAADAPVRGGEARARGALTPSTRGTVDALLDGRIVAAVPPTGWRAAVERARASFTHALEGAPATTAPLVAGMVLGDTSTMPKGLVAEMRVAGLAHLTAVSGAHFAILAAALGALLRRARASPGVVAVTVVVASACLAVTVSGGGSVLRALVMAGIAAAALLAGRRGQTVPALAAAVVVLVVARPELARDVGLALSVGAVLAITLLAPGLSVRLRRRLDAPLADAVALTLAAQTACVPILASIDAGTGPWAVAANAVATPFAVPVTLLGVAALVVAVPAPGLAALLADAAARCAWPVILAARAANAAPGGSWDSATGLRGIVLGLVMLAGVAVAARAGRTRGAMGAVVALVAAVLLHAPSRYLPEALGGAIDGWSIVACDVGQGDAMVVRSGGAVLMVDVGPADGDAAGCLARLGVSRVDLLVLTHEHADHTGGLAAVADAVEIGAAWMPPAASASTLAALREASPAAPVAGERVEVGGIRVEVLQTGPEPRSRDGTEVNDSSTALRIDVDGLTLLALGDLEVDGQRRLERLGAAAWADVDVVKAAHHGSAAQDAALIRAVAAPVVLISVGAGNDYGHPAPEALALYGAGGAAVLRTDLCGDVVLGARDGAPTLVRECRSAVGG